MKDAAMPISAIERTSPKTSTIGCSRAAPATASTLSSDMETSAMTICQAACAKVFRGGPGCPVAVRAEPASASSAAWLSACEVRSSRHIFQHTQRSRMPPARSRPTMARSQVVMPAKRMRSTVAATMPTRIALFRCSRGSPAAARPMTMALSPASTRSIMMTWRRAVKASAEKSSFMRHPASRL